MIYFLIVSPQKTVVLIGFHSNNHKVILRETCGFETFYDYVNLLNILYNFASCSKNCESGDKQGDEIVFHHYVKMEKLAIKYFYFM